MTIPTTTTTTAAVLWVLATALLLLPVVDGTVVLDLANGTEEIYEFDPDTNETVWKVENDTEISAEINDDDDNNNNATAKNIDDDPAAWEEWMDHMNATQQQTTHGNDTDNSSSNSTALGGDDDDDDDDDISSNNTNNNSTDDNPPEIDKCPGMLIDGDYYVLSLDDVQWCDYSYSTSERPPVTQKILTHFTCRSNGCHGYFLNKDYVLYNSVTQSFRTPPTCSPMDDCRDIGTDGGCNLNNDYACTAGVRTYVDPSDAASVNNVAFPTSETPGEYLCEAFINGEDQPGSWCRGQVLEYTEFQCPPSHLTSNALTHYCPVGHDITGGVMDNDGLHNATYKCYYPEFGMTACTGTVDDSWPVPDCQSNLTSCADDEYQRVCLPDTSEYNENFCGNDSGDANQVGTTATFECFEKATHQWCRGHIESQPVDDGTASCPELPLADCADVNNLVSPHPELCTCHAGDDDGGSLTHPTTFSCTEYGKPDAVWCQGTLDAVGGLRTEGCPPVELTEMEFYEFDCKSTFVFGDAYSCQLDNGISCGGRIVQEGQGNDNNTGGGGTDIGSDAPSTGPPEAGTPASSPEASPASAPETSPAASPESSPAASPASPASSPSSPSFGSPAGEPSAPAPAPTPTYIETPAPVASNNDKPGMVDDEFILFQDDDTMDTNEEPGTDEGILNQFTNYVKGNMTNNDMMILAAVGVVALLGCFCFCRRRCCASSRASGQRKAYNTGYRSSSNNTYQGIGGDGWGDMEMQNTSYGNDVHNDRGLEFRNGEFM